MGKRGKKQVNKRMDVRTEFRELSNKEWGHILSLPWPPATRQCICLLFLEGGAGLRDLILLSWSAKQQINQVFIKNKLPYRIRNYRISNGRTEEIWFRTAKFPSREYERNNRWISRVETKLCTITVYKLPDTKDWIPFPVS